MEKSIYLVGNQSLNTPFFWVFGVMILIVTGYILLIYWRVFAKFVYHGSIKLRQDIKKRRQRTPTDYKDTKDYKYIENLYNKGQY